MKTRGVFGVVFFCLLVLIGLPANIVSAGEGDYRALVITRGDYGGSLSLSPGPENDGKNFERMLENAYGDENIEIVRREKDGVTTVDGVKEAVQTAFADSDADDVNYFYYSGHGLSAGLYLWSGQTMSAAKLAECFEGIQGTNILVIDCCYAGALAGKGYTRSVLILEENEEDFVDQFVEAFETAVMPAAGSRSALTNSRFRLLMAASSEEQAWQMVMGDLSDEELGIFTSSLVFGGGTDPLKIGLDSGYDLGMVPADLNRDGSVSWNEIYRFIQNECLLNHVRVYPESSESEFLPVEETRRNAVVAFEKAEVAYDSGGNPVIEISYNAASGFQVEYAYYQGNSMSLSMLLGYSRSSDIFPNDDRMAKSSQKNIAAGSGKVYITLPVAREILATGSYAILLRVPGQSFTYMLPFSIVKTGEDDTLMKNFTLSVNKTDYIPEDEEELRIRAGFGTGTTESVTGITLSCYITDKNGTTVRTPGTNEQMQVIQAGSGSSYNYYRDFYWDGRTSDGTFVPTGTYTAYVTAWSGNGEALTKTVQIQVRLSSKQTEEETEKQTEEETENKQETKVPASSVYVKAGTKKITKVVVGRKEKLQLTPVVLPSNTTDKKVTYSSNNAKVASVNDKGVIQGKKTGTAKITVKSANGKKAVIKIRVKKAPNKLKLKVKTKKLKKNGTYKIGVLLPSKTASYKITYKSNNRKVASVSTNGKVYALRKGKAIITVKTFNGETAKLSITVK